MTLTFEQLYDKIPGRGWLSKAEARLLWDTAAYAIGPILEVGCYYGRSTVLLADAGRPVYSVDPFSGFDTDDDLGNCIHQHFLENVKAAGAKNVQLFRQRIEDWEKRPVGMAYLDGDHTQQGTINQIEIAKACGAKLIAIHDISDSAGGRIIKEAALSLLGPIDQKAERLAVWEI